MVPSGRLQFFNLYNFLSFGVILCYGEVASMVSFDKYNFIPKELRHSYMTSD